MCNVIVVKQTVAQAIQHAKKIPPNWSTGSQEADFHYGDSTSVALPRMPNVPAKTSQTLTKSVARLRRHIGRQTTPATGS